MSNIQGISKLLGQASVVGSLNQMGKS